MIKNSEKILRYVRDAWRSRWWGVLVAALVCIVGWTIIFLIPNQYEARASVYVNTASSLAPMLNGIAVESDVRSQLELVKQLLLSNEILATVAEDAQLDKAHATDKDRALTITELRQLIQLSGGRSSRDNLYTITFRDHDRAKSLAVVQSLLDHFIKRTIRSKRGYSDSAARFLNTQKDEYEKRLSAIENQLAEFKRKNMGLLPGERLDYFGQLQQAMDQRNIAKDRLAQLLMQRDQIKRQMSGESPVTAVPGGESGTDKSPLGGMSIDRRIAEAESKLNQMRLQWTDKHPEVVGQRELIERLRDERAGYLSALGVGHQAPGPVSIESNPVYTSLRLALSQLDLKVFELNAEVSSRAAQIAQLERMADTLPQVEAEYQQLNRGYTVMKEQYEEVVKRLEKARLSGEAEQSEDVDFRIIEPASVGGKPAAPNRLLLLPAVCIFALALGVWVALAKSALDPVFYSIEEVTEFVEARILGAIGFTAPEVLRAKKRRSMYAMAGVVVSFLIGLTLVVGFEIARNSGALAALY
jgi:polysaccharide chain length determinant protein (PEP-CTERM system associated)